MPLEPVGVVTLAFAFVALICGRSFACYAFIVSTLFGAAAAINAPMFGSIQPSQLLLATLVVIVAAEGGSLRGSLEVLRFPGPGFWLLCTWIYGVLCAIFLPRILDAGFLVNPVGSSKYGDAIGQIPFGPTTGNVSQSIYFTGDLLCFMSYSVMARTAPDSRRLITSVFLYCALDIVLALADLGTYYTGTSDVLSFIRNAKYVIYVDTDQSNIKRIIGSFTEASAFASATLGVFGFSCRSWMAGLRPRLSFSLTLASFILLILSTSTTAYVGLACAMLLFFGMSVRDILHGRATVSCYAIATVGPLLLCCCALGIMLHSPTYDALRDFLDETVLNKASSQSGVDRGLLNQTAFQNVFDTGGLGTGIGGVRTSSFVLAVLANLGMLGGAAYVAFLGAALAGGRRTADVEDEVSRGQAAARSACVCLLISASISGALIDLGLPFFVFAALACARSRRGRATVSLAVPSIRRQGGSASPYPPMSAR